MSKERPYVLSIAGFDASAGAGVLSDCKTFEQLLVYGLSAITANTFQNDSEFIGVNWISADDIIKQCNILFEKYEIDFVKIGLIENFETFTKVVEFLKHKNSNVKIVWDTILKSSSGFPFHNIDLFIKDFIFNNIYLLTPNWIEYEKMFFNVKQIDTSKCSILLKGGHRSDKPGNDILITKNTEIEILGESFGGKSKHGTGCVLSSAITAFLAKNYSLYESCKRAKKYVENFILSNSTNLGYHT